MSPFLNYILRTVQLYTICNPPKGFAWARFQKKLYFLEIFLFDHIGDMVLDLRPESKVQSSKNKIRPGQYNVETIFFCFIKRWNVHIFKVINKDL